IGFSHDLSVFRAKAQVVEWAFFPQAKALGYCFYAEVSDAFRNLFGAFPKSRKCIATIFGDLPKSRMPFETFSEVFQRVGNALHPFSEIFRSVENALPPFSEAFRSVGCLSKSFRCLSEVAE
ncbi:MAG TPA: hypothetical protein PKY12_12065, partial [Catalimonadaceae bacterium]|nr:hypothetical protein [Catalimonadaceae bacterium]